MAVAKWATPSARGSNIASTNLNSLANGSESTAVTFDNSTARDLYGIITIKLGSITPATAGAIAVRITLNDGTDTSDRAAGDVYIAELNSGASAKVVMVPMVRLYPFSMRISVRNNSGVAFNASGNELYVRPYNEDVT
jgi:hypothetical protein